MATRAKYTRANVNEENHEAKLDTDILMRFSPSYGNVRFSQGSMFRGLSLSFSENQRASLPLKQLKNLWIRPYGLHR